MARLGIKRQKKFGAKGMAALAAEGKRRAAATAQHYAAGR